MKTKDKRSGSIRRLGFAAILFGAIMGGGVASGSSPAYYCDNILGWHGVYLFPVIIGILFLGFYIALEVSRVFGCKNYNEMIKTVMGPTIGKILAPLSFLWLIWGYVANCGYAFSGAGGLAKTYGLSNLIGGILLCVLCLLIMAWGQELFFRISKYISYIMIAMVLILYGSSLISGGFDLILEKIRTGWTFDNGLSFMKKVEIEFAWIGGYIPFVGVILAVALPLQSRKDNALLSVDCFLFELIGYYLPAMALLAYAPSCFSLPLPMTACIEAVGIPGFQNIYSVLYLAALLTTASSLCETLAQNLCDTKLLMKISQKEKVRKFLIYICVFAAGLVFSNASLFGITDFFAKYSSWLGNLLITIPIFVLGPIRLYQAKKKGVVTE